MPKKPSALKNAKQVLDAVGKNRKTVIESSYFAITDRKDARMRTHIGVTEAEVEVGHSWGPVPQQSRGAAAAFIRGYRAAGGTDVDYFGGPIQRATYYGGPISMRTTFGVNAEGVMPSLDEALAVARRRWDEFIAEVPVDRSTKSTEEVPVPFPQYAPPVAPAPMPVSAPVPAPAPVPVVPDSAFAALATEAAAHAAAATGPNLSQYT
jgi:hypothetical protein